MYFAVGVILLNQNSTFPCVFKYYNQKKTTYELKTGTLSSKCTCAVKRTVILGHVNTTNFHNNNIQFLM